MLQSALYDNRWEHYTANCYRIVVRAEMNSSQLPAWSDQPVSAVGRILASILLAIFAVMFLGCVAVAVTGGPNLLGLGISSGSLLGAIYVFPFLYCMAAKGRYPRHWLPWR